MSSPRRRTGGNSQFSKEALQESAKRQVSEVLATGQDAVASGAWIYPIQGIYYLLSHPRSLTPLIPTILKAIAVSLVVVASAFFFTYLPIVTVLAFVTGPLAFIAAIPLVLGLSYLVIMFLTRTLLLATAQVDLFDAVLLAKNHTQLVQKGRLLNPSNNGGKVTQLGKAITRPLAGRFSTDSIVRYVLSLPLNLIPVVGTVFFLGYNGYKAGPGYHARYFQLKNYDKSKRQEVIHRRRGAYTAFGTVAMVLNLIPVISVFFTLTTAVGAALWASDIENKSAPPVSVAAAKNAIAGSSVNVEQEVSLPSIGSHHDEKEGKKEL